MQFDPFQHGIDVFEAEPVDQNVTCAVIAYRNHDGSQIAQIQASEVGSEPEENVAPGNKVLPAHRVGFAKANFPLLGLKI